jgi:hypothetical protein
VGGDSGVVVGMEVLVLGHALFPPHTLLRPTLCKGIIAKTVFHEKQVQQPTIPCHCAHSVFPLACTFGSQCISLACTFGPQCISSCVYICQPC